jgi:hypothetical protein
MADNQRWVPLTVAATSAQVHPRSLYRWCTAGLVVAKKLAGGVGPWRVQLDSDGMPVDGPGHARASPQTRKTAAHEPRRRPKTNRRRR